MIQIDRCVCFQRTFGELKETAERVGQKSVSGLQAHVEFGLSCKLCLPYVERMLETGQTLFNEVIEVSDVSD